jgi:AhpD family alkylhydroperoxidase
MVHHSKPMSLQEEFHAYRSRMNARILGSDSKVFKRLWSLDTLTYQDEGVLDKKTKELMGLCVSLAMRCDSCVKYHIEEALKAGANEAEIVETFEIATVIGGSIVIPELRRAFDYLDELLSTDSADS